MEKIDFNQLIRSEEVKKLRPELWELRTRFGKLRSRLFFSRDGEECLFSHGIIKKTQKVPPRELDKAEEIIKLYKKQNYAPSRIQKGTAKR
jgi:phage-related protein